VSIVDSQPSAELSRSFLEPDIVQRVLKVSDFVVLFFGTAALFAQSAYALDTYTATMMTFSSMVMVFATLLGLRGLGAYEIHALVKPIRSMVLAIALSAFAGLVTYALTRAFVFDLPLSWLASWMLLPAAHFGLSRMSVAQWLQPRVKAGMLRQRVAIVGGGKAAEDAINLLERSGSLDIEIVGLFDDRDDNRSPASVRTHKKIGRITDLAEFARQSRVDLIVVAIPLSAEDRLLQVLNRLWELPVDIRISGQSSKLRFAPSAYEYLGDLPMLSVFDRPLAGWHAILKDIIDRVIASAAIVALSPVMLATAAAIRLESKGPVIFKQKRYGFNNELVEVWKFRSMLPT
jgi:FlaA1/EpsC-like NDP-sugar epimerase